MSTRVQLPLPSLLAQPTAAVLLGAVRAPRNVFACSQEFVFFRSPSARGAQNRRPQRAAAPLYREDGAPRNVLTCSQEFVLLNSEATFVEPDLSTCLTDCLLQHETA